MFTGIITARARVIAADRSDAGLRLTLENPGFATETGSPAAPGESIAVNGVCLTVLEDPAPSGEALHFDVIGETLNRTTLGGLEPGVLVHAEHAATANALLGGHIVQGHVDALGTVRAVQNDAEDWRARIEAPPEARRLIAPKGSITIDGVSLTIASVDLNSGTFEIALIPTTLERTQLGGLTPGDSVNIETDVIARQVANYLDHAGTLTP